MTAKGVTIQLDVPRKLRFDGLALLRLEEITGENVLAILRRFKVDSEDAKDREKVASQFPYRLLIQIVQAGLTEDCPRISIEQVVQLMDENGKADEGGAVGRILSYTPKVFAALSEALGNDPKNVLEELEKTTPAPTKAAARKKSTAV